MVDIHITQEELLKLNKDGRAICYELYEGGGCGPDLIIEITEGD